MDIKFTKMPRRMRRYLKNREGATALEFAILIVPFLWLIFGIIELAVVFFFNSTLTHATSEVAREIRTGQFQKACKTQAQFKQEVCGYMAGLGDCQNRLKIDVVKGSGKFSSLTLPSSEPERDPITDEVIIDGTTGEPQAPPEAWTTTAPRDVVIVRARYYHKLAIPTAVTRLANQPGNIHRVESAVAFRNEPFPAVTCP